MAGLFDDKIDLDGNKGNIMPLEIIQDIINSANEELKGIVKISVNEYDGHIFSYERLSLALSLRTVMGPSKVDIQDDLGEVTESYSKYDVTFGSDYLPDYKYRLMFLGYGISGYPTTLVLERGVADDINGIDDSDYIIKAKDKDELKYYFETIIKSAPVIDVLQDIANAARIRIEKKN